jgi:hypothetical protein
MDATAADLRTFCGLPDEVPEALLLAHLDDAARDLRADTGLADAPADSDKAAWWRQAHILRAYASALPYLHTFSLSGAAKAGRLVDQSIDFRFLDAREVDSTVARIESRYQDLLGRITFDGAAETPAAAFGMLAV